MKGITVYIDESGTLPDPKDKVVVIAAVGTESVEIVDSLFKQVKKKAAYRKPTGELKFYTAGEKTKTLFFETLINEDFAIYTLTVDKMGRKIPDTPENYAALCCLLLNDVLSFSSNVGGLIFDQHFSQDIDRKNFNHAIKRFIGKDIKIHHVDSIKDRRVNIADMISGAVLAWETGKDNRFYEIIEKKIISSKKVKWVEVKRRFLITKKTCLNRCKHPSKASL